MSTFYYIFSHQTSSFLAVETNFISILQLNRLVLGHKSVKSCLNELAGRGGLGVGKGGNVNPLQLERMYSLKTGDI